MMRVICLASLFAATAAFTTQPNAFSAPLVGERASTNGVAEQGLAHRNRRATIVMDGKANGEFYVDFVPGISLTHEGEKVSLEKYQFSQWECLGVEHCDRLCNDHHYVCRESFSVLKAEFSYLFYHNDDLLAIFLIFFYYYQRLNRLQLMNHHTIKALLSHHSTHSMSLL
jgi:hypothetical protein